jgi:hypothetical protein
MVREEPCGQNSHVLSEPFAKSLNDTDQTPVIGSVGFIFH